MLSLWWGALAACGHGKLLLRLLVLSAIVTIVSAVRNTMPLLQVFLVWEHHTLWSLEVKRSWWSLEAGISRFQQKIGTWLPWTLFIKWMTYLCRILEYLSLWEIMIPLPHPSIVHSDAPPQCFSYSNACFKVFMVAKNKKNIKINLSWETHLEDRISHI